MFKSKVAPTAWDLSILAKASKQIQFRRRGGRHLVSLGGREIEARGLADSYWTDRYHRAMSASWPVFFGTAAAIFVTLNAVFAFLAPPCGRHQRVSEVSASVAVAEALEAFAGRT